MLRLTLPSKLRQLWAKTLCTHQVLKHMDAARSQDLLDHDYALFQGHMLALDHAANFIGHLDCTTIVGDEQRVQDCFEIVNAPHPSRISLHRGDTSRVASNLVHEIVNDVSCLFLDHELRQHESAVPRKVLARAKHYRAFARCRGLLCI